MTSNIGCIGLVLIAGFIGYLFYRRKQIFKDLQLFYQEGNYVRRNESPVPDPFVYKDLAFNICSDGFIKKDMPYTLMLATRFTGAGKTRIQHDYIGFYFPVQVQLNDEWLNLWKQKVAERGDGWAQHSGVEPIKKSWGLRSIPESLPFRATRIADGTLIAWMGLHNRKNIETHIKDILDSLNTTP